MLPKTDQKKVCTCMYSFFKLKCIVCTTVSLFPTTQSREAWIFKKKFWFSFFNYCFHISVWQFHPKKGMVGWSKRWQLVLRYPEINSTSTAVGGSKDLTKFLVILVSNFHVPVDLERTQLPYFYCSLDNIFVPCLWCFGLVIRWTNLK